MNATDETVPTPPRRRTHTLADLLDAAERARATALVRGRARKGRTTTPRPLLEEKDQ